MVKQTCELIQTLTLRKLLGHFMSTPPRLHAYDTPCRDMFPESFKNERQHTHAHQNTCQTESKHNPTVLERLFVAALKALTFIGVVFLSLGFQQHLNQALVLLIFFRVCYQDCPLSTLVSDESVIYKLLTSYPLIPQISVL